MNFNEIDFNYNIIEIDFQPRQCQINFELTKENFFLALEQQNIDKNKCKKEWENFKLMSSHFVDNPIHFFNFDSEKINFLCKNKGYKKITQSKVKNVVIQSDCIIYVTFADVFMLYDFSSLQLKPTIINNVCNNTILTIDFYISKESFEQEINLLNLNEENAYTWISFINYLSSYYDFYNTSEDNINLNLFSFNNAAQMLGFNIDKSTFLLQHVAEEKDKNGIIVSLSANILQKIEIMELTKDFEWNYKNIHLLKFRLPKAVFITKFEKTFTMKFEITFDYYKNFIVNAFNEYTHETLKNSYNSFQKFFKNYINNCEDLKIFDINNNKLQDIAKRWGYNVDIFILKNVNIEDDIISFRLTANSQISNFSQKLSNIEDFFIKTKDFLNEYLTLHNKIYFKQYAYELDKYNLYDKETFEYIVTYLCRSINNNTINGILHNEQLSETKFTNCYVTPSYIQYDLIHL